MTNTGVKQYIHYLLVDWQKLGGVWDQNNKAWRCHLNQYDNLKEQLDRTGGETQGIPEIARKSIYPISDRLVYTSGKKKHDIQYGKEDTKKTVQNSIPHEIQKELYDFQKVGIQFGLNNSGRVLFADEMGVGKTIQAICLASCFRQAWPLVILCPSSLKYNWKDEILKWDPSLRESEVQIFVKAADDIFVTTKVLICSYDIVPKIQPKLAKMNSNIAIADEAHYLKNPVAKRTIAIVPILQQMKHVFLLTGTPAFARPKEMFTLLSIVRPDVYKAFKPFGDRYCDPKPSSFGMGKDYTGSSNEKELHYMLKKSIMIRRLKVDVLSQLPKKRRKKVIVNVDTNILNEIQSILKQTNKSSLESLFESVRSARPMQQSEQSGSEEYQYTSNFQALALCYRLSGQAKLKELQSYIQDLLENDLKLIIFAHHLEMLNSLENFIVNDVHKKSIRIDGSVEPKERHTRVQAFQTDDDIRVAILSLSAAGSGLTLTASSNIVFAEMHWTPAIIQQAEDRAHRIGQENSVLCHYIIGEKTLDEFLYQKIDQKIAIVSNILDGQKKVLHMDSVQSVNGEITEHEEMKYISQMNDVPAKDPNNKMQQEDELQEDIDSDASEDEMLLQIIANQKPKQQQYKPLQTSPKQPLFAHPVPQTPCKISRQKKSNIKSNSSSGGSKSKHITFSGTSPSSEPSSQLVVGTSKHPSAEKISDNKAEQNECVSLESQKQKVLQQLTFQDFQQTYQYKPQFVSAIDPDYDDGEDQDNRQIKCQPYQKVSSLPKKSDTDIAVASSSSFFSQTQKFNSKKKGDNKLSLILERYNLPEQQQCTQDKIDVEDIATTEYNQDFQNSIIKHRQSIPINSFSQQFSQKLNFKNCEFKNFIDNNNNEDEIYFYESQSSDPFQNLSNTKLVSRSSSTSKITKIQCEENSKNSSKTKLKNSEKQSKKKEQSSSSQILHNSKKNLDKTQEFRISVGVDRQPQKNVSDDRQNDFFEKQSKQISSPIQVQEVSNTSSSSKVQTQSDEQSNKQPVESYGMKYLNFMNSIKKNNNNNNKDDIQSSFSSSSHNNNTTRENHTPRKDDENSNGFFFLEQALLEEEAELDRQNESRRSTISTPVKEQSNSSTDKNNNNKQIPKTIQSSGNIRSLSEGSNSDESIHHHHPEDQSKKLKVNNHHQQEQVTPQASPPVEDDFLNNFFENLKSQQKLSQLIGPVKRSFSPFNKQQKLYSQKQLQLSSQLQSEDPLKQLKSKSNNDTN